METSSDGEFVGADATMAEIVAAATPEVVATVLRYAQRRLDRGASAWCDETAKDLADGALCATVLGDVRWPRERITLARHLMDTINHDLARRAREESRTLRADHLADDDARSAAVDGAVLCAPELADRLDRARAARRVLAWVYSQAPDDAMRVYIDAVLAGCHGPREVAAETGMSYPFACAIRRRARRLLARAPADLRADVAACLS